LVERPYDCAHVFPFQDCYAFIDPNGYCNFQIERFEEPNNVARYLSEFPFYWEEGVFFILYEEAWIALDPIRSAFLFDSLGGFPDGVPPFEFVYW